MPRGLAGWVWTRHVGLLAAVMPLLVVLGLLSLPLGQPVAATSVADRSSVEQLRGGVLAGPLPELLPVQGGGVSNLVETENLRAQLVAETASAVPGASVDLALVFEIRPHWHTYWRNPGDSGEPPRLTWRLPAGVSAGPIQWTYPSLIRVGPLANYGYSGRAVHLISLSIPPDWRAGEPIDVEVDATWLVCDEHCIPEQGTFALSLQTAAAGSRRAVGKPSEPSTADQNDRATEQWSGSRLARRNLFATARAELPVGGVIAADLERGTASPTGAVTGPATDPLAKPGSALGREQMRLSVPAAALPSAPSSVTFFADEWGLIEHAAPQTWRVDGDRLLVSLTPGAAATSATPTGLLVVEMASAAGQDANLPQGGHAPNAVQLAFAIDASTQRAPAVAGAAVGEGPAAAAEARPGAPVAADAASARPAAGLGHAVPETLAGAEDGTLGLPLALAFALLGGLILNLMPCVFPVLAIKALSLAQQGRQRLAERVWHGLAYTAGMLSFFLLVALLLLALRAGGAAVGWGFQLQSPTFVLVMAYLFLTLGLSLSGAITLGTSLMGIGAMGPSRGHLGAFMTGALAALVAAPCTAPFMGAALGFALAQPWPAALSVVLVLGLGMALPFLLIALSPALAKRLPRPGAWMETLKQLLAFPMFATAAWLLWVLTVQTGPIGLGAGLAGVVLLALGLWLLEAARGGRGRWQRLARVSAGVSLAAALWLGIDLGPGAPASMSTDGQSLESAESSRWARSHRGSGTTPEPNLAAMPYTASRLDAALAIERPVFVNMTAAWCITCLVNERVALSKPAVVAAFAERDLLYLKGDWTNRDAQITEYLAGFGRSGVPLYVYYPPGAEPQVLPQVLTESIVLDML